MPVKYFDSPEEESVANQKVQEFLGCKPPITVGSKMIIALWVKDESKDGFYLNADGTKSSLAMPESDQGKDRYNSCSGMVVALGPSAYTGEKYIQSEPWCKIGDWVGFPRHVGCQAVYKGKAVHYIYCDDIFQILENPSDLTRF